MIFFIKSAFLLNTPRIEEEEEEEEENGETKEKDHDTCWILLNRSWCIPVCSQNPKCKNHLVIYYLL
jgi:hypothetical protein